MSEIRRLIQKPFPGIEVDMYDIDLTSVGGTIKYFTNWTLENGEKITWRGNQYDAIAMEVSGYETSGEGKPARPKMRIGNSGASDLYLGGTLSSMAMALKDFVGCKVSRWRTYRQFLDDGDQADPSVHFPVEAYRVSQKTEETPVYIEWELCAPLDQEGMMLPKGVMTQKYCPWTYRQWDAVAEEFDYNKVICPYAGEDMFDEFDEPTDNPALDRCSKRLSGCRLRFGETAALPTGAFPGMLRLTLPR